MISTFNYFNWESAFNVLHIPTLDKRMYMNAHKKSLCPIKA